MNSLFAFTFMQALTALTLALLVVLSLRKALQNMFGVEQSYAIWLLVPLLPLSCFMSLLIPDLSLPILPVQAAVLSAKYIVTTPQASGTTIPTTVKIIWLCGVALHLLLQSVRQIRYVQRLKLVRCSDDFYSANTSDFNPALVGLFHPKIIVPSDFFTRYSEEEQRLILTHEKMHQQRGDYIANATCSLLVSLFWFHPLLHFCATRFRFDQELACDAAVLRLNKNSRKAYANAMLKASTTGITLPAACYWQSHQFLKERIMKLNKQTPRSFKRVSGQIAVSSVLIAGTCLTWAAQSQPPASSKHYDLVMTIKSNNDAPITTKLNVTEGQTFALVGGEKGQWTGSAKFSLASSNSIKLELALAHGVRLMGHPTVIAHFGETAKVETSDGDAIVDIDLKASPAKAS